MVKEKQATLLAEKIPNSKIVIFTGEDHEAPEKMPQFFNQTVLIFLKIPKIKKEDAKGNHFTKGIYFLIRSTVSRHV